jgi:hypothetical protein
LLFGVFHFVVLSGLVRTALGRDREEELEVEPAG